MRNFQYNEYRDRYDSEWEDIDNDLLDDDATEEDEEEGSGTEMRRRRRKRRRRRTTRRRRRRPTRRRRRRVVRRRKPKRRGRRRRTTRRTDPRRLQRLVKSQARALANRIIRERDLKQLRARFGRIFTSFDPADIIENQQETVTKGLWSGGLGNLVNMFTSSDQTDTQKRYYYEIFQSGSGVAGAQPQYSIAWGHVGGSGSADEGGQVNDTPSRAIYSQYRNLLLEPGDKQFTINGVDNPNCFFVNVNRARFKERLDEGNIEFNIQPLSGNGVMNSAFTGSHVSASTTAPGNSGNVIRLIDDSKVTDTRIGQAGQIYALVSGSIERGVHDGTNPHYYGLLYPQVGVAVIGGKGMNESGSFNIVTGSEVPGDNALKLFTAMSHSAAMLTDTSGDRLGFQARSSEKVKSTHYFVRVKNSEYNFSNNPTFVTGSRGQFKQASFLFDPKVYVTSIGMYNNRRELLAVAKISKPLLKSFTREALIKVKLDF